MSGYKVKAETPYYRKVKDALNKIAMGSGFISQVELAEMLQVSRNTSLRRAMEQARLDGLVKPVMFEGAKGGRCMGYETTIVLEQQHLFQPPF